ncbi:MAG TPA: DUF5715 family protein [Longimicrobium sp.]|nr:DUF5715 family protein [Longimicrobium sp.]
MRILPLFGSVALLALGVLAEGAGAQSLRGSPASVDRMYGQAREHDLTFFRTGRGVREAASSGTLVRMSGNEDYRLTGVTYPYALPATRTFVQRLSAQYRDFCGERLVITSAARPRSVRLFNSAGDKSVHAAGMAVDIRKPGKTRCLRWLRETLLHVEGRGAIEATEEFRPPHFHVAVFPTQYLRYVGRAPDAKPQVSSRSRARTAARETSSSRGATRYRVRRGDSLWAIARRHGTSVERLKAANDLRSSRVVAGQTLVIPTR